MNYQHSEELFQQYEDLYKKLKELHESYYNINFMMEAVDSAFIEELHNAIELGDIKTDPKKYSLELVLSRAYDKALYKYVDLEIGWSLTEDRTHMIVTTLHIEKPTKFTITKTNFVDKTWYHKQETLLANIKYYIERNRLFWRVDELMKKHEPK